MANLRLGPDRLPTDSAFERQFGGELALLGIRQHYTGENAATEARKELRIQDLKDKIEALNSETYANRLEQAKKTRMTEEHFAHIQKASFGAYVPNEYLTMGPREASRLQGRFEELKQVLADQFPDTATKLNQNAWKDAIQARREVAELTTQLEAANVSLNELEQQSDSIDRILANFEERDYINTHREEALAIRETKIAERENALEKELKERQTDWHTAVAELAQKTQAISIAAEELKSIQDATKSEKEALATFREQRHKEFAVLVREKTKIEKMQADFDAGLNTALKAKDEEQASDCEQFTAMLQVRNADAIRCYRQIVALIKEKKQMTLDVRLHTQAINYSKERVRYLEERVRQLKASMEVRDQTATKTRDLLVAVCRIAINDLKKSQRTSFLIYSRLYFARHRQLPEAPYEMPPEIVKSAVDALIEEAEAMLEERNSDSDGVDDVSEEDITGQEGGFSQQSAVADSMVEEFDEDREAEDRENIAQEQDVWDDDLFSAPY